MTPPKPIDDEYAALLLDFIASGVFREGSPEAAIVTIVAAGGIESLDDRQRSLWYERILPVVSKPLSQQAAIAAILRNGGRVPARIDIER